MPRRLLEAGIAVAAMVLAALVVALVVTAGNVEARRSMAVARALTRGDPERGREAIVVYGCGACHAVNGVAGADGKVGPDLRRISTQIYGGAGQHDPDLLIRWILQPRKVRPDTAMPDLGLSETVARDIAAYLLYAN
jgi:cytochrome c